MVLAAGASAAGWARVGATSMSDTGAGVTSRWSPFVEWGVDSTAEVPLLQVGKPWKRSSS